MAKYMDYDFYIPIDVAKGIDYKNGCAIVNADDEVPADQFVPTPKCKFCSHYVAGERGMGTCRGFENEFWAYEECGARNCEKYVVA